MKKLLSKLLLVAAVFVCCLVLTQPVMASSTSKLKVTYKKKTVTICDTTRKNFYTLSYPKLKKSWGKPYKTVKSGKAGAYYYAYTYKAGKSTVKALRRVGKEWGDGEGYTSYEVTLRDKNMKLNGVYVGMTKAKALSLLKKSFGKKKVTISGSKISVNYGYFCPIEVTLKNGKVSKIWWFVS